MSALDDTEFVEQLVERTEKFVANELAKFTKEINELKKKQSNQEKQISQLQTENEGLKQELDGIKNKEKSSGALVQALLEVGESLSNASGALMALGVNTSHQTVENQNQSSEIYTTQVAPVATSTPSDGTRKRSAVAMTQQLATALNDLDPTFRNKIEPYYSATSKFAKSDLLNPLQKAFVRYRAEQMLQTKDGITAPLVAAIINEGVEEHIWSEKFSPGNTDFTTYISTRLKNERKRIRRNIKLKTSNQRLKSYVEQSLGQMSGEVEELRAEPEITKSDEESSQGENSSDE